MYVLKPGIKEDPQRHWALPDRIFFGRGACHILAGVYLERPPLIGFHAERIVPVGSARGSHVYLTDGSVAFDCLGYSARRRLLDHHRKGCSRQYPGWDCVIERVDFDLLDTAELNRRNMSGPDQFLSNAAVRARAYLDRIDHPAAVAKLAPLRPLKPSRLRTERCSIIPLSPDDIAPVAELFADSAVRKFLGGPVQGKDFESRFGRMLEDPTRAQWAVRLLGSGAFAGVLHLHRHHDGDEIEVSYQFLPTFWGQGLAFEAVSALIEHAVRALGLTQIVAETQAANARSRRLLERLGMTPFRTVLRFGERQVIYGLRPGGAPSRMPA